MKINELKKELFVNAVVLLSNGQIVNLTRGLLVKLFEGRNGQEELNCRIKGMTAYIKGVL